MDTFELASFLNDKVEKYNNSSFIANDPISVPHRFHKQQDIEIMAFFASIFAWGQRKTIINKSNELAKRLDNAPYDFVLNHTDSDLNNLLGFKHRTFNDTDLLYTIEFFRQHFQKHNSLEDAFIPDNFKIESDLKDALTHFHNYFFSLDAVPQRTKKHISSPAKKSSCKRLCMFLRWMVRNDNKGVDFGIWKRIKPSQLIIPLDVHVLRAANKFSLLDTEKADWNAACTLTDKLRMFDQEDPVKYDFALFALSVDKFI